MKRLSVLLVAALFGCGDPPKPETRLIISDTYCKLTDPQSWSVKDTTDTIDGVRKSEAKRQCTCVKPKPAFCSKKDSVP